MTFGPMPDDHTQVGGVKGEFAEGRTARENTPLTGNEGGGVRRRDMQPVEQHSPTKVHVPAWKTIVLGGSGGIYVRT